ncbi:MAG: DAK2 domain-containing protein [Lachnospiraceae bacterium]|nr:DAK2 domain-containing protein [Lachnospiraceae bacterium]
MEITTIDAKEFQKCFLAAAKCLESEKERINELNVFPVPDGDTGTNMTMTVMAAAKEVAAIENPDMHTVSKAISSGSLRGARGNSGVILSQLFRGFTKVIKTEEVLTVEILCEAMQRAVETAYKAVMKPKEGTILTVARGAADKALEIADSTTDIVKFAEEVVKEAEAVLEKTPDMLPVLKQAGVVDSGGQGLVQVLKGALMVLHGEDVDLSFTDGEEKKEAVTSFTYNVAFSISPKEPLTDKKKKEINSFIENICEILDVKSSSSKFWIKLNTDVPGEILTKAIEVGSLHEVTIKNMKDKDPDEGKNPENTVREEAAPEGSSEKKKKKKDLKPMGFITVSSGKGLSKIFKELGADVIIEGGQTMNPSTDDILKAVDKVDAENVFVLPNNKNIILAANQAAELSKDKKIFVVPTKTLPQGITALINFMPDSSPEENKDAMTDSLSTVKSGQITYAVRDTVIDDKEISEGDYMGIGDSGILSVSKNMTETFLSLLHEMVDDDSAVLSIYYGKDAKKKEANALYEKAKEEFPELEVEFQNGGQPVYYYVVSVE